MTARERYVLYINDSPAKIFLMVRGRSPRGESFPPSKLNPSPVPSFFRMTVKGGPRGASTNFKSGIKLNSILGFCEFRVSE